MITLITLDSIANESTDNIGVYRISCGNDTTGALAAENLFYNANGNASGFGVGSQFASFFLVQA